MIFNLNDENCDLPTTGKGWEILLDHVKENAMHRDLYLGDLQDDDIIEELQRRGLSVADVFEDDDIRDHIHDGGMPIDEIFDEDEILECGCVIDAMDELEKKRSKTKKKNARLEKENAELKAKVAELEEKVGDVKRLVELERQLVELREGKMKTKE